MAADDEIRNGGADGDEPFVPLDPDELLAGEDAAAGEDTAAGGVAVLPGDDDLGPEFVAEAGTADIGVPDEQAADELVGDDAGAAEWGQMDAGANGHQPIAIGADDDAEVKALEERLERLERVQQEVVRAARAREAARVRRKVVASTAGAGAASFVPILLQLVDAFHLSPELAATVSSVVAALGALVAGYMTPERPPILPPDTATVNVAPAPEGHA
ncbi:MAG TPA: hypothetical protein VH834_11995 [Solirubrobacteraceae bacterium]|jgi:hypothetical protein